MKLDFTIDEKNHSAHILIEPTNITNNVDQKNLLTLITIISADFYLDPELELEQISDFVENAKTKNKNILFSIDEDGIDLEFVEA